MNQLPCKCVGCGTPLLVNQKDNSPLSHTCTVCYENLFRFIPITASQVEKDKLTRSIDLIRCNPDELDLADFDIGDWELIGYDYLPDYPKHRRCECGAEAAGDPYHSDWCPIYVSPMSPKVNDSEGT